jgi:signal transduction histidine kinase
LFIDYLLNPLKILKYGIGEINNGNLGYKIKIKSADELEDIGDSFNSMSNTLYYDDIRKKEFVQNASHELKTPIAGIKTMTQFILMSNFDETSKEFLKDIDHEVDRMNNIITDLLTLAELQNSSSLLNKSKAFTQNLIYDTLTNLKMLASKKNITINTAIENFEISVDILKFQRVLVNLIDNAIKYSNCNSNVYINCKKINDEAIIEIKDNGMGIPKDSLLNIFQRFYRVDKARSRKTGGTGLGLAIVKEIVELHGGEITVESTENVGTTFTIRIRGV